MKKKQRKLYVVSNIRTQTGEVMKKEIPEFYLVSDSLEDDVQGAHAETLKQAKKIKKNWAVENGFLEQDDCPSLDIRIYKIVLVE